MTELTYGSRRFSGVLSSNKNVLVVGGFDRSTKLVAANETDVTLCLPRETHSWGNYPTHQASWLSLAFVCACHARHTDAEGLQMRRDAFAVIPTSQWPALAARAADFGSEFRKRLSTSGLSAAKTYKSATRALQDCLLYAVVQKFPENQDDFLKESSLASLISLANDGRRGKLDAAAGLALADSLDAVLQSTVEGLGGMDACRAQLVILQSDTRAGRVVVLPRDVSLEDGVELLHLDVVVGVPDAHDADFVTIVSGQRGPDLVQLKDRLAKQRLDIIRVSACLDPTEVVAGKKVAFQSVAEMILANGLPRTQAGRDLIDRLTPTVSPADLARKYRKVARELFFENDTRTWTFRRTAHDVPPIKKVTPLYRIACDLLPRAVFMESCGRFPAGEDTGSLADTAGLGDEYRAIQSIRDRQDATQEVLEAIAAGIRKHLENAGS